MITVYIFAHFGHYCSDLYAGSFMAYLRQPVGQQEGVLAGFDGLGRLEQPCSGAVVHASGDRRSGQLRGSAGRPVKSGCADRRRFWVRVCCGLHVSVQTMAGAGPLKWLRPLAGGLAIW